MSKRRIDMTIQKEKHIMGITAESTVVTSTMHDSIKSLSEEEWEWVTMTHKELKGSRLMAWNPFEDPRPEWRIKETQIQISGENAQKDTSEENIHPRKNSVPEACKDGLRTEGKFKVPSPAIAGRFDNQDNDVAAIETEHNDYKRDKKRRLNQTSLKRDTEPKY